MLQVAMFSHNTFRTDDDRRQTDGRNIVLTVA